MLRQTLALADRDREIARAIRCTTSVVALRIQPKFRRDGLFADHSPQRTLDARRISDGTEYLRITARTDDCERTRDYGN